MSDLDKRDADDQFEKALILYYGTQIKPDIQTLMDKITAVTTAHLYAGSLGDNPLCKLNRCLDEVMPILMKQ